MTPALRRWRWKRRFDHFQRSLWFLPACLTGSAVLLFLVTTWADRRYHDWLQPTGWASWLELAWFASGPTVAEALLTTIVGMWATIIGVCFSVTLVTIQLTATKYIAQVLPLFERNRSNQAVLGVYLATVTYAMLVSRTVQFDGKPYVPYIGVNVATGLAVLSIFLLILFITNVVNFVRPSFFLDRTLADTNRALSRERPAPTLWRAMPMPTGWKHQAAPGVACVEAGRKAMLTDIGLDALGKDLHALLHGHRPAGKPWIIRLLKSPGEAVHRGERMAQVVGPDDGRMAAAIEGLVRNALDLQSVSEPRDNPDVGIESLAGLTIKGAVQGDLDVTFEGIDCLFSLLARLVLRPEAPRAMRLAVDGHEVWLLLPSNDMLGKLFRELTVISEVALAPSLPFRLVTEGMSRRLADVMKDLIDAGEAAACLKLLHHMDAWYQSAFFHLDWVNGMHHLADDLADMAIAAHDADAMPTALAVAAIVRTQLARFAPDHQAQAALGAALARIEAAFVQGPDSPAT